MLEYFAGKAHRFRRRALFVQQLSSPPHAVLEGVPVCQVGTYSGPLRLEPAPRSLLNGLAASAWLEVVCRV